ncbi:MAG: MerR family transcriptional regulator [Oscillospiraceae bacterium]|nr:MerR family transcriptional regulator [Oscillospiraceae bacterium]
MSYTISEMAARLGVAPSTLRYYDKEGLLPFVQRTEKGIRRFTDLDYEWLQVIECLKQTGLQLREIRAYIEMAMEGDATIGARLQLFYAQRQRVQEQMARLQQTLDMVNFKCWYYETAQALGSTAALRDLDPETCPAEHRQTLRSLRGEEEQA